MIGGRIVRNCLILLLGDVNAPDARDLEALCALLSRISTRCKTDDWCGYLDALLPHLAQLSEDMRVPPRVRFALRDVVVLLRAEGRGESLARAPDARGNNRDGKVGETPPNADRSGAGPNAGRSGAGPNAGTSGAGPNAGTSGAAPPEAALLGAMLEAVVPPLLVFTRPRWPAQSRPGADA
jgi:hypothetical protein